MVNTEILGALKSAMARGQSLPTAMQTLINSGYPQNEIQEAAGYLETGEQPQQPQPVKQTQTSKQPISPKEKTPQKVSAYESAKQRVTQKQTQQNQKQGNKVLIITLIIVLAILLGALVGMLIFKEQIISFFSS